MVKYCSTVTVIAIYLIPLYHINTFCLSSSIQISRKWLTKILFLSMVIAAPNSAAELAGIIMSNLTSHAKSQYTDASDVGLGAVMAQQTELCQPQLEPNRNKWLHHRAGASRCCVAVAAVEKRWHYLKEGISLPLYQILEIWYLTTSFFWMALPWPQVSMWGILIRFLTRIYASVVGFPRYANQM